MKKHKREIIIISSSFALLIVVSIISNLLIWKNIPNIGSTLLKDSLLLLLKVAFVSCFITALYAVFFVFKKKFIIQFKKAYLIIFPSICILLSGIFLFEIPRRKEMHDNYEEMIAIKAMSLEERLNHEINTNKEWQQDSILMIFESEDSIFPSNIKEFKHIKSLHISETNIKTLPKELAELKNLTKLSLLKNKIDTLPEVIFELEKLQRLSLGNNNLKYISPNIKKLKNLKHLFLWGQAQGGEPNTNIPKEIGELENLTILSLSVPNIDSLPRHFNNAENITRLTLADTKFDEFPSLIFEMTNLEHLTFFFQIGKITELPSIPNDFEKLTKLKSLTIQGGNITTKQKARLQELLPNLEIVW